MPACRCSSCRKPPRCICSGSDAGRRRYAQAIRQDHLSDPDAGKAERQAHQYLNVDDAIAAFEKDPGGPREWRTHIHVPVFLDDLGQFRTTRFAIADALKLPQAEAAVAASGSRDLHLGHAAGEPEDRATSSTTSAASSIGCAANWSDDSFPSPLVGQGREGGREVSLRAATSVRRLTTPTPNPSPQGGGEQLGEVS